MKKIFQVIIILFIFLAAIASTFHSIKENKKNTTEVKEKSKETKKEVLGEVKEKEPKLFTIDQVTNYKINEEFQADASKGKYSILFNRKEIEKVNIDIAEENFNYLINNAKDKPTVLTNSVTIGNYTVGYAGIKTKGESSLLSIINTTVRFSFTINFGKYINKDNGYKEKQNLLGLKKVALNNIFNDPTLMKEYLSYELNREMGIPTPEYSIVKLYINDEFFGIYQMVESIESPLTERTLNEKSDLLLKPETPGGNLVYNNDLEEYYKDGEFDFTSLIYDKDGKIIYPEKGNPLYKYSGLWERDEDTFKDISSSLPTLFKWLKTLNELSNIENPNTKEYKNKLESIMDVDEVIRYFAVNTFLVNMDSYQGFRTGNYVLFINEKGKASILPWDLNYSFGGILFNYADDIVNFNIDNPLFNVKIEERPLLNVILKNNDYKKKYLKYLKDCTIITEYGGTTSLGKKYEKNHFGNIIYDYHEKLVEDYSKDPTAFFRVDEYENGTFELASLIKHRSKAVRNQINGDYTKEKTLISVRSLLGRNH